MPIQNHLFSALARALFFLLAVRKRRSLNGTRLHRRCTMHWHRTQCTTGLVTYLSAVVICPAGGAGVLALNTVATAPG